MKDIAFFEELNEISKNNPQIVIEYCLTQEKMKHLLVQNYSRIDEEILKKRLVSFSEKSYYVCGSISFVNDMWKLLKTLGASEADIFTESFF